MRTCWDQEEQNVSEDLRCPCSQQQQGLLFPLWSPVRVWRQGVLVSSILTQDSGIPRPRKEPVITPKRFSGNWPHCPICHQGQGARAPFDISLLLVCEISLWIIIACCLVHTKSYIGSSLGFLCTVLFNVTSHLSGEALAALLHKLVTPLKNQWVVRSGLRPGGSSFRAQPFALLVAEVLEQVMSFALYLYCT